MVDSQSTGAYGVHMMTTTRATKSEIKTLNLRLATLKAELKQPLTKKCGPAAAACIREDIALVKAELKRRLATLKPLKKVAR